MTKEEAKLVLDNARPQTKEIDRQFYDDEDLNNALDMAIKALEQQPSNEDVQRVVDATPKDCVSLGVYKQVAWERDIAIEQLKELGYGFGEKIRTSEDCVSRAEVIRLAEQGEVQGYECQGTTRKALDIVLSDSEKLEQIEKIVDKWNNNASHSFSDMCKINRILKE